MRRTYTTTDTTNLYSDGNSIILKRLKLILFKLEIKVFLLVRDSVTFYQPST
jgi:hypothetical protein